MSDDSLSIIEVIVCNLEQLKSNDNSNTLDSISTYFTISINEVLFKKLLQNAGMFMRINSDDIADGQITLRDNKSRDLQEKRFDVLKK